MGPWLSARARCLNYVRAMFVLKLSRQLTSLSTPLAVQVLSLQSISRVTGDDRPLIWIAPSQADPRPPQTKMVTRAAEMNVQM